MRAFVVADLGFGDAGKGLLTDFLVRRTGARLVVRYNGGAQAGHNVVTPDGRHHTFAQFGAGSFVPGVATFLSRHVVIHPTALLAEARALAAAGVADALDRLQVSETALVITPFHQAAGRLRELARGPARHGSCGVGVGEAVKDALAAPEEAVRAGDLRDRARLRKKLSRLRDRKREEVEALEPIDGPAADRERQVFVRGDLPELWLDEAVRLTGRVVPDTALAAELAAAGTAVFEGAQGVLLDEWAGFHPYTTWSRCTPENALGLLAEAAPAAGVEVVRIGVLRTHAVRHGPGPLPTESLELRPAICDHNRSGPWQGEVRYGWFDAVLARYALEVAGPLDRLALTHLDVPARLGFWRLCSSYELPAPGGLLPHLYTPAGRDLARQERLTELLSRVRPVFESCPATEIAVRERTAALLGREVDLVSRGPRAEDVTVLGKL